MSENRQQYVCLKCGTTGADSLGRSPLCHICDYKSIMVPSNNGKAIDQSKENDKINLKTN